MLRLINRRRGALRPADVGREVVLCGWVHARRDHGGVLYMEGGDVVDARFANLKGLEAVRRALTEAQA